MFKSIQLCNPKAYNIIFPFKWHRAIEELIKKITVECPYFSKNRGLKVPCTKPPPLNPSNGPKVFPIESLATWISLRITARGLLLLDPWTDGTLRFTDEWFTHSSPTFILPPTIIFFLLENMKHFTTIYFAKQFLRTYFGIEEELSLLGQWVATRWLNPK